MHYRNCNYISVIIGLQNTHILIRYIAFIFQRFNSLPNKFLDWSKLKAFADKKINASEKLKIAFGRVENVAGKGENAGYQHFLLFPQCFQKASYTGSLKVMIVWQIVNLNTTQDPYTHLSESVLSNLDS